MKVYIERSKQTKVMDFNGKAIDLLKKLDILVEEVLIARNNEIVTEDVMLKNDDEVKILSVISGG
ncbi:MoaD/ThiS family protein [Candidatus Woesearchaeota archaeon]|nr:MoaD/ThiS family protein [Candidatus Woesearchaeota archaeon]